MLMSVVQVHLSPPNSKPTVSRLWAFWFSEAAELDASWVSAWRSGENVHRFTQTVPAHLATFAARAAGFAGLVRRRYAAPPGHGIRGHLFFHTANLGDHRGGGSQGLAERDGGDVHGVLSQVLDEGILSLIHI